MQEWPDIKKIHGYEVPVDVSEQTISILKRLEINGVVLIPCEKQPAGRYDLTYYELTDISILNPDKITLIKNKNVLVFFNEVGETKYKYLLED